MRVYDIAKKYNITSKEVIQLLRLYQVVGTVKGKMSGLSIEQIQVIDDSMNASGGYMQEETEEEKQERIGLEKEQQALLIKKRDRGKKIEIKKQTILNWFKNLF